MNNSGLSYLFYLVPGLMVFLPLIAGVIFLIVFFSIRKKRRGNSADEMPMQEQTETANQENITNEKVE